MTYLCDLCQEPSTSTASSYQSGRHRHLSSSIGYIDRCHTNFLTFFLAWLIQCLVQLVDFVNWIWYSEEDPMWKSALMLILINFSTYVQWLGVFRLLTYQDTFVITKNDCYTYLTLHTPTDHFCWSWLSDVSRTLLGAIHEHRIKSSLNLSSVFQKTPPKK